MRGGTSGSLGITGSRRTRSGRAASLILNSAGSSDPRGFSRPRPYAPHFLACGPPPRAAGCGPPLGWSQGDEGRAPRANAESPKEAFSIAFCADTS